MIVAKFADHLPLHRQAKIFRRFGAELSDQTMCGWMRQCAELLSPLYRKLKDFVLASKVVGTDDTPVKVLDRNLPQTRKGRIWPYVGDHDHPAVIYDYTPTRERAGPEAFLKDYRGHLQADAYVAYDSFSKRALQAAAAVAHRSVSEFVLESALARADEALADRRTFGLNATQWKAFMDAPSRPLPRLERLLKEPGFFDAGPNQ